MPTSRRTYHSPGSVRLQPLDPEYHRSEPIIAASDHCVSPVDPRCIAPEFHDCEISEDACPGSCAEAGGRHATSDLEDLSIFEPIAWTISRLARIWHILLNQLIKRCALQHRNFKWHLAPFDFALGPQSHARSRSSAEENGVSHSAVLASRPFHADMAGQTLAPSPQPLVSHPLILSVHPNAMFCEGTRRTRTGLSEASIRTLHEDGGFIASGTCAPPLRASARPGIQDSRDGVALLRAGHSRCCTNLGMPCVLSVLKIL